MKPHNRFFLLAILFAALFFGFTVIVCTLDVAPIGPLESAVGCSALNGWAGERIGTNDVLYAVSEALGLLSLLAVAGFALLGVYQLLKRRSFRRVDPSLYALAVLYVAVLIAYGCFELVVINHRPVLTDGALEASYPSSHTMLAVTVMASAAIELFSRLRKNKTLRITSLTLCIAIGAATVIARTLSGVHWITDIVGSLLLSATLLMLYLALRTWMVSRSPDAAHAEDKNNT